ncbi:hypothetical protein A2U01_0003537 [Trifolium medium]|uniref:Putative plant transposon protein domain-containing protein n=1 Tax=Trifolium medium TaxID=97028 RepID=A0A392M5V6_9FABA|nr:hypothetical protein [Trifolium medium]
MRQITEACGWMNFNNMIDNYNISWVKKFYANSYGRADDDYTSFARGVEISYAPSVIDGIFGFIPEEHCSVMQRRADGQTEEPISKTWANWFVQISSDARTSQRLLCLAALLSTPS